MPDIFEQTTRHEQFNKYIFWKVKMSEADRLLHEIGYMKEYEDSCEEIWNYEERFCIKFNKVCKSVDFKRKDKRQFGGLKYHRISIDMQELQAINMKAKELNWI